MSAMSAHRKPWTKLAASGVVSAFCYLLLYLWEPEIMASFTRTDGLYPLLPVAAAFVISFAHGAFTGYFWEVIGIHARPRPTRTAGQVAE